MIMFISEKRVIEGISLRRKDFYKYAEQKYDKTCINPTFNFPNFFELHTQAIY
jgi:hypothetical protein